MKLKLYRYGSTDQSTGGALSINGQFHCHTCEDEKRTIKLYGETRIPSGRYRIKLRIEGGMNERYKIIYPRHRGMLWLQNVVGFKWIYIHPGRHEWHTDGCILVGYTALSKGGFDLDRDKEAYNNLYAMVIDAIDKGEQIFIDVINGD